MKNIYDDLDFFNEYAKMYRSQKGLEGAGEWHQLQPLFPDLTNKEVLDLGCGYGWHSRYAAECGAKGVVGIDLSENMIEAAKKRNAHRNIEYQVCDLMEYDYPIDRYDFVISNLVLHYIEDLDNIYRKIYQTLKKEGVFLSNIEHPALRAVSIRNGCMMKPENLSIGRLIIIFIREYGKPIFWERM